jgi:S1-C subfamily serine protease
MSFTRSMIPVFCVLVLLALPAIAGNPAAVTGAVSCDSTPIELYREVSPSVVSISGMSVDPFHQRERVKWAVGSGVVVDQGGLVLTNAHLVLELDEIYVATDRGRVMSAELVGADSILDLALIRLEGTGVDLKVARLGDSDTLQVGEDVLAIGNSMGLEKTLSRGIISGLNRTLPIGPMSWLVPYIQTDAALSSGNSGGPLINHCGEVIGINSSVLGDAENIGFAVPVNIAKDAIPELLEHGRILRPWHGINGRMLDISLVMLLNFPLVPGFLVETIEPGSAADEAGLVAGSLPLQIGQQEFLLGGDVITRINGEALSGLVVLMRLANSLQVGDTVEVEYFRAGELHTIDITLPERPALPGDLPD